MAATAHPVDPVAPAEILKRLPGQWAAAKETGDLFFFDSTTRHVGDKYRVSVEQEPTPCFDVLQPALHSPLSPSSSFP